MGAESHFQEGRVTVTRDWVLVGHSSYALKTIHKARFLQVAVESTRSVPGLPWEGCFGTLGLLLLSTSVGVLAISSLSGSGPLALALIGVGLALLYLATRDQPARSRRTSAFKYRYQAVLDTTAGELRVLTADDAEHIRRVVDAVNQALSAQDLL